MLHRAGRGVIASRRRALIDIASSDCIGDAHGFFRLPGGDSDLNHRAGSGGSYADATLQLGKCLFTAEFGIVIQLFASNRMLEYIVGNAYIWRVCDHLRRGRILRGTEK